MESAGRRIHANVKKPTPRSGHVAVPYSGLMLVWGGYMEQVHFSDVDSPWPYHVDDVYLDGREVWCYNMEAKMWDVWQTHQSPPGMSGSCAACTGRHMYLFGGYSDGGNSNELYRLDLKTKVWTHLKPEGTPPSPRDKGTCMSYQDKLVIFGGFGPPPYSDDDDTRTLTDQWQFDPSNNWLPARGWNNQLFVYSTTDNRWSYVKSEGHQPCPRAAHAAAVIGSRGYVFGGRFGDTRMNDLHVLNLDSMQWVQSIQPATADIHVPPGRSWHCLAPVSDKHLLVYGGYSTNSKPLNDVWVFEADNCTWQQQKSLPSETRMWHTGVSGTDVGEAVVFGGCSNDLLDLDEPRVHSSRCFHFFFSPKSLSRLCSEAIARDVDILGSELKSLPAALRKKIELFLKGLRRDNSKSHSYNLRSRPQSS